MSYPNHPSAAQSSSYAQSSNYHPHGLESPLTGESFQALDTNTIESTSTDVITRRLLERAFSAAGQESLPNAQSHANSEAQHLQAFESDQRTGTGYRPNDSGSPNYSGGYSQPRSHSQEHYRPSSGLENHSPGFFPGSYQELQSSSPYPSNASHYSTQPNVRDARGHSQRVRQDERSYLHGSEHDRAAHTGNSAYPPSFGQPTSGGTPLSRTRERQDERRYPHDVTNDDVRGAVRALQSQSLDALNRKISADSKLRSVDGASSGSHSTTKSRNGNWNQKTPTSHRGVDVRSIRADFPALHQDINGHQIVWFDNGATTHKPLSVIEAMTHFYACDYSNIHRAAHTLAARATDHYEAARETVRDFINAESTKEIVFVRGTTEGINFIAHTCKSFLNEGDEILLTEMEHHANIVPWQLVAEEKRARIRVIPIDDRGEIIMDEYRRLLSPRTKLVSVTHASNTLGTIPPVEEMAQMAHRKGAKFIVDGAQSIAHMPVDVQALGCDFFVFSGHKVFAPTGIGAVYVHPDMQEHLPPWQGGGNMIHRVSFDGTTFSDPPAKFEAGTPSIGDAVGLGAALRYVQQFDPAALLHHEHLLLEHATRRLESIRGVRTIGHSAHKVGVVSFVLDGYSTEQVGKELDRFGIAVRTGHHCAQPSLRHFGLESTVRPSFALYNTLDEIDRMAEVIQRMARKA